MTEAATVEKAVPRISVSGKVSIALRKAFNQLRIDEGLYKLVHGTLREFFDSKGKTADEISYVRVSSIRGDGFLVHILWKDGTKSILPFAITMKSDDKFNLWDK